MTKNDNDKNRVRFWKQNFEFYNRKVKQRKDERAKSLVGSISNLFNVRIQKSLPSSQVREAGIWNIIIYHDNLRDDYMLVSDMLYQNNHLTWFRGWTILKFSSLSLSFSLSGFSNSLTLHFLPKLRLIKSYIIFFNSIP